jgi:GrpB-like predicted nucleotidyltransferase (UPF0157 family)
MDTQILGDALISLVPPFLVGIIFYVMLRSILRADSKERKVYAEMEEQMRAEQAETVKKAPKLAPKTTAKVTKSTKK